MGIFPIENIKDDIRMIVVLGKDDGLAQLFAVIDAQAFLHEDMQHFPDGIFVEDPLVEGG